MGTCAGKPGTCANIPGTCARMSGACGGSLASVPNSPAPVPGSPAHAPTLWHQCPRVRHMCPDFRHLRKSPGTSAQPFPTCANSSGTRTLEGENRAPFPSGKTSAPGGTAAPSRGGTARVHEKFLMALRPAESVPPSFSLFPSVNPVSEFGVRVHELLTTAVGCGCDARSLPLRYSVQRGVLLRFAL